MFVVTHFNLMQDERLLPFLVCSVTCITTRIVVIFCMIQLQCCSSFKVKFAVVCAMLIYYSRFWHIERP